MKAVFRKTALLVLLVGVLLLPAASTWAQAQDSDTDGLTDEQEAILGTNPRAPDTDGDGWLDGAEYFTYFTDPLAADTDADGVPDSRDLYPRRLVYQDLNGITTTEDSLLQGEEGPRLHQLVQVKVGNVITIDWTNFLDNFALRETRFTIRFDFLDPSRPDFQGDGYYRPVEGSQPLMMAVRLPSYEGIFETVIPWSGPAMTVSDWIYHLYSKPFQLGQIWEFNVFYHELMRWGEDPFFRVRAEIVSQATVPLETRLGRRNYPAYEVRATFKHVTFQDPFFKAFLGENPELVLQASIVASDDSQAQILLRYTTPFFRITPTKSVGFSDFLVQR